MKKYKIGVIYTGQHALEMPKTAHTSVLLYQGEFVLEFELEASSQQKAAVLAYIEMQDRLNKKIQEIIGVDFDILVTKALKIEEEAEVIDPDNIEGSLL